MFNLYYIYSYKSFLSRPWEAWTVFISYLHVFILKGKFAFFFINMDNICEFDKKTFYEYDE